MADLQQPLTDPEYGDEQSRIQTKWLTRVGILSGFILISLIGAFVLVQSPPEISPGKRNLIPVTSRGVSSGVSEKKLRHKSAVSPFPWSNDMLSWQKTAFHFQPKKNWMNDPNGPLFYKGWYHLFFQYNPDGAVWGNIVWGHAVSRDLINWQHLPLAMVADRWYDINGVWTGSATLLPDGRVIMLYTGSTNDSVQVQNLAYPEDPSDPLLITWVKYSGNPVLFPPPGIDIKDFRDPTTAWFTPDEKWRIVIGSKVKKTGISLIYDTTDFISYELKPGILHGVPGTGMWECVDFYPISRVEENGLDTSLLGPDVKHVLKASLDDDKNDYYALGSYFHENTTWLPDDRLIDVGIGLRYDYGDFYASKTFYDNKKQRRILWGWIRETDSERADVMKGWASLQSIPRTVLFDKKTGNGIKQWPVEEIESLRTAAFDFDDIKIRMGSLIPLDVGQSTQLDITAEFEIQKNGTEVARVDGDYDCHGAARRGALGPFGLLVLANDDVSEHTAFYFYLAKGVHGGFKYFFCSDESRSSKATDVAKEIHGSAVPVLDGERLSMRLLVDHSIVESFAMGGRSCITSRVYPTSPPYGGARVFLFNNATLTPVSASVKVWQMKSASMREYVPDMKM